MDDDLDEDDYFRRFEDQFVNEDDVDPHRFDGCLWLFLICLSFWGAVIGFVIWRVW